MARWNNVSLASPYLDADEWSVRVEVDISVGSFQIFAVGVSSMKSNWLTLRTTTSTSSLNLFYDMP